MTAAALGLILLAGVAHASWNVLAKQAEGSGLAFVWCFAAVEAGLVTPLAVGWILTQGLPSGPVWIAALLSGLLHTVYFVLLQRSYRSGDLSVVYPIARGLGPLLAVVGAVALLGERLSTPALVGAATVSFGVLSLARIGRARHPLTVAGPPAGTVDSKRSGSPRLDRYVTAGAPLAALTGISIAAYTLWDGYAMSVLLAAPLPYFWVSSATRLVLLSTLVTSTRAPVRAAWQRQRWRVLVVGVLSPTSYLLILVAFTLAPVGLVAPAREVSIVIATVLGIRHLGEGEMASRLVAAAVILLGVVVLSAA